MAKMDFLPNLDLSDLAEYGLGLPQYPQPIPNKPFSWRIQSIKKLLPAWCDQQSISGEKLPLKTPLPRSKTQNLTKVTFFLDHPVDLHHPHQTQIFHQVMNSICIDGNPELSFPKHKI